MRWRHHLLKDFVDGARRLAVFAVIALGVTGSAALWREMKFMRDRDYSTRFGRATDERAAEISEELMRVVEHIHPIAAFASTLKDEDPKEFGRFVSAIVTDEERANAAFVFLKCNAAPANADGRLPLLSADSGQDPRLRQIAWDSPAIRGLLEKSRDHGKLAVSPVPDWQGAAGEFDLLAVLPVYKEDAPRETVAECRENLAGFVFAIIDAGAITEQSLSQFKPLGIDVQLLDVTTPAQPVNMYSHPSRLRTSNQRAAMLADFRPLSDPRHRVVYFPCEDRLLEVAFAPTPMFAGDEQGWDRWTLLGAGLLSTALLAFHLHANKRREGKVRELVRQRTMELNDVNAQLQASSAMNRAVLDSAKAALISVDTQGIIRTFNAGAERLLGYAASEVVGRCTPLMFHLPEEIEARARALSAELGRPIAPGIEIVVAKIDLGAAEEHEWTFVRKDKSTFPALLSITRVRNEKAEVTGHLGIAQDLTERRKVDEALRKLSRAVEQSPAAVMITDIKGIIEYVNPKFVEVTGYTPGECLGQNPRFLKSGFHPPEFYREVWETLAAGNIWRGEFCNRHKSGELFWESAAIAPVRNAQGVITNYVAIKEDTTQSRKDAEKLKAAVETAERANRAKSDFLSNISHELRTPLNGVIGMAELLRGTRLDREQRQFADACHNSATVLLALINDILDFSKIEAGKLELDVYEFDFEQMVMQAVHMVAPRAREKGLDLFVDLDPEVCGILRGDGERIRQILANFLTNAVKFTASGNVRMRVTCSAADPARRALRCEVIDTGIGIPADRLRHLFAPFTQVDASTTRRHGGTGLGLAICKSLVEAMHGQIGALSLEGTGSNFWFTITLEPAGSAGAAPPRPPSEARRFRILMVDAVAARCENLRRHLATWEHAIVTVPDVDAARAALLRPSGGLPFDVVLIDADANDIRVLAFLEWMQVKLEPRPPRILLMVPFGEDPSLEFMERFGIVDSLSKPVLPSALFRAMSHLAERVAPPGAPGEREETSRVAAPVPAVNGRRILLAEDNRVNQLVAAGILRRAGYMCDIVNNGVEALTALGREIYDLILMDGQMPELDGYNASRKIREAERNGILSGRIPILALTASAIKGDREKCLEAGMDDYITKPVDAGALIGRVEALLAARRETPMVERNAGGLPAGGAARPAPPIDGDALLARCRGDAGYMRTILLESAGATRNLCAHLATDLAAGDSTKLAAGARALQGAANSLAAGALAASARKLEDFALAGSIEEASAKVVEIQGELQRCLAFIPHLSERLRRGSPAEPPLNRGGPG